jgi:hypothetical protein
MSQEPVSETATDARQVEKAGSDQLYRWLTLAANVGVLLGLILVMVQINQNTQLARSAYRSEGNVVANQIWANLMGDRVGDAIEKSVECPSEMTHADFMALDAFLFTSINMIYRDYQLAQEGLYSRADWQGTVDLYVDWYLANPFATAWWHEEARTFFPEEFAGYVDEKLNEGSQVDHHAHWLAIRTRVTGGDPAERPGICRVRAEARPAAGAGR